ncbi:thioesterase family protein [Mycolicibacter senuensis]|uniref:Thioesterase n=1 Tax=Mycolicibacter senuensis TaxID=386913 RepID=A0A7I9XIQ9_9MYCO|nr:thioesterase family protein [Mycolicibacter senuensis]MDQ2625698.1 thioesterase family protein [Actinomycetota bacterium]ORW70876.1 thioesterase [Mycolicibacter senuensis]GFG69784.1 thioesterase [Mycolicibacter senuensis]
MNGSYYHRAAGSDGVYESSDLTRSNWGQLQHGSPPLALLTREIERLLPEGQRIARLGLDILAAIPVAPVRVQARVQRPGRRICLLEAEMHTVDDDDRPVARVSAWALATGDTSAVASDRYPPLVDGPSQPPPEWFAQASGYARSADWRLLPDSADGAAVSWLSPRVHLVDSEQTTALQRLAMVVDSANGVGAALDVDEYMFMNTDTVVHLHREPAGEDFGLRARASIGPDGIGVTTAELFDRSGFIGTSAQALLVQRR